MDKKNNCYNDILFGIAIGDAIGVPVEFKSRETVSKKPITDMIGFGTYGLPPGTWSDSSLTFCLADALTFEFDLSRIAQYFIAWRYNNFWTARGEVFDVGITTQRAIDRLAKGLIVRETLTLPQTEMGRSCVFCPYFSTLRIKRSISVLKLQKGYLLLPTAMYVHALHAFIILNLH